MITAKEARSLQDEQKVIFQQLEIIELRIKDMSKLGYETMTTGVGSIAKKIVDKLEIILREHGYKVCQNLVDKTLFVSWKEEPKE